MPKYLLPLIVAAFVFLVGGQESMAAQGLGVYGGPTYTPNDPPANAFDGSESTYWQGSYNTDNSDAPTPFTNTSWTLGYGYSSLQTISGVEVDYAVDSRFVATDAQVECSTDGSTWTTLATLPAGQNPYVAVNAECQWVQIVMGAPGTGYSPAIWEVNISATPYSGPPPPPPPLPDPTTASSFVSLGDSITAGSYAPVPYTTLLPIFRELPPFMNKGVSGNDTEQMLARMSDVLTTSAQVVILMGGTNDCQFGWPTSRSMAAIGSIVQQTEAAGKAIVLVGPIPRNELTDAGAAFTPCLLALRAAMSAYATANNLVFADPWAVFEDPPGSGTLNSSLTEDGTHPNERGAYVLAKVIATALGWGFPND